jgi:hypothetical protein
VNENINRGFCLLSNNKIRSDLDFNGAKWIETEECNKGVAKNTFKKITNPDGSISFLLSAKLVQNNNCIL